MAELRFPNMLAALNEGMDRGRSQRFNALAGQAYGAPAEGRNALLQQAVGIDAQAGVALDDKLQERDDGMMRRAYGAARYVKQALDTKNPQAVQGAYAAVRPFLARIGAAQGKVPPEQWSDEMIPEIHQILAQGTAAQGPMPTGIREFEMKAQAAGLVPGSPEYQEAANIALGRTGRAPSGGFGFKEVVGADGRTRLSRTNPRTGAVEVYDEATGEFAPLGGAGGLNPGAAGGGVPAPRGPVQEAGGMSVVFDNPGAIPPQVMAAIQANPDGWGSVPDGTTARISPQQAGAWPPAAPPSPAAQPARGGALGVSQSPAEKAFAEANAKNMAEISTYDQMTRLEAERAAATERAKGQAEAQVAQQYGTEDSRKAAREASQKLPQLQNAVRGVERIEAALGALDRGVLADTGPIDQFAQRYTQSGQELESAVGAIQNSMLSLTRVPGVGSQSDLEARVANMQYPSLDKSPEVNRRTMQNLRMLVQDLQQAYGKVTRAQVPGQGGGAPAAPAQRGPAPGTVQGGYRFRGGNPADPSSWERL